MGMSQIHPERPYLSFADHSISVDEFEQFLGRGCSTARLATSTVGRFRFSLASMSAGRFEAVAVKALRSGRSRFSESLPKEN